MNKVKKIIKIFIVAVLLIITALQANKSIATSVGEINYVEREERGFYSIQKWNGSAWIYITYSITHYTDNEGVKRIAYCIDPNLKGVGWISGEVSGYDVKVEELLSNEKLWRVYSNGYPYRSPAELGVETDQDAYLATKMAGYAMLYSYTSEDVRRLYRPGEDVIYGQSMEDIQRRGKKVISAMCELVDIGNNGQEVPKYDNLIQIQGVGELSKDSKNPKFYSKTFKVNSAVSCKEFSVDEVSGFPEGTIITDENGNVVNSFTGDSKFKVMIRADKIKEEINGKIGVSATLKNNPIYYAKCNVGDYQNYILCCDAYSRGIKAYTDVKVNVNKSSLKIEKTDVDSGKELSGVEFEVKYEDGTNVGTFTTDKNGLISIENLKPGKLMISEIKAKENYVKDSEVHQVELNYEESKVLKITNEKKKGSIKIIKIDAENNQIKIKGAKFEVYDENSNLLTTLITNENGEAKIENIPIDSKYIIKEVETAEGYVLDETEVTVELKENEIKNIVFENKKKIAPLELLPRTGEQNYLIYLYFASVVAGAFFIKNLHGFKKK